MTTVFRWIQLLTATWLILIVVQSLSLDKRHFKYLVYVGFFATNIVVIVFAVITLKQMYRTSTFTFLSTPFKVLLLIATITYLASFNVCWSIAPDSTRWLYLSQVCSSSVSG